MAGFTEIPLAANIVYLNLAHVKCQRLGDVLINHRNAKYYALLEPPLMRIFLSRIEKKLTHHVRFIAKAAREPILSAEKQHLNMQTLCTRLQTQPFRVGSMGFPSNWTLICVDSSLDCMHLWARSTVVESVACKRLFVVVEGALDGESAKL